MKKLNIAIDGYSSCGKSTLAKALAKKLGYVYVDSGAMYRAITLYALENNLLDNNESLIAALPQIDVHFETHSGIRHTFLNGKDVEGEIRGMEVSSRVSDISALAEVRKRLRELQQKMASRGGVVMDGRDIGTAVLPQAQLKIFMTADPEIRAQRRYLELTAKGIKVSIEEVRANLEERDLKDTTRKENPLRKAEDARVLDNSHLSQDEQLDIAYTWSQESLEKS